MLLTTPIQHDGGFFCSFVFIFSLFFLISFRIWNWNADDVQLNAVERLVRRKDRLRGRWYRLEAKLLLVFKMYND